MKRLKLFSVFAFFALLLAGCSDSASDNSMALLLASQSGGSSKAKTLSARIAQASNGDVIDIDGEGLTVDSNAYTISKNITIKNGDLNGVSFTIADSGSRSVSDLFVILEGLKGLASVDVQSGGSISITKTEITTISVSADSASLTVVSATVESLEINGEGSKLKVSSTTVSTLTVGEGVESVALGGTTEVSTLTVVNISSVEIVKTAGAIVTEAKDESGADISGEIGEATGFLRTFNSVDNTWTFKEICYPDAEGIYTVQYKQLKDANAWNFAKGGTVLFDANLEKNKNYKFSFKAKASADTEILVNFQNNGYEENNRFVNLQKGEWTDVILYTSKLLQSYDGCELQLIAENWKYDVDIQYKDFNLEETTDAAAPLYATAVWCKSDGSYTMNDFAESSVDSDGVVTIDFKKDIYNRYNFDGGGCNVYPLLVEKENLGKLYKVSYEVMVENPVSQTNFLLSSDVSHKEGDLGYGWSWALEGLDNMPTGTWVKVINYVPTSASSRYLYDDKDICDSAVKIWIGCTAVNTVKVRNFELEVCEEMPLNCFWVNQTPIYHPVNIEYIDGLKLPANESISGKITFAPEIIWTSNLENNTITACTCSDIFNAEYLETIGIEVTDVPNAEEVMFVNKTSKDIYLRFNLQNGCMNFVQELNPAEDEQFVYFDPHPKPEQIVIMGRKSENSFTYVYNGTISWSDNRFSTKIELGSDSESYSNFYVSLNKKWYDYPYDSEGHTGSIMVPYGSNNAMTLGKSTVLTSYHDNGGIGNAYLSFLESGKTYTATGVWDAKTKSVTLTITE